MDFVISEYTSAKLSNILSDYSIVWHNETAIKQVVKITAQSSITKIYLLYPVSLVKVALRF